MRQFNVFSPEIVVHCLVAKSWPTLCDPVDCSTPAHLPCSSPSPGVCPNSCPLSWWCYLIISSPATRGGLNSRVKIRFSLSLSPEKRTGHEWSYVWSGFPIQGAPSSVHTTTCAGPIWPSLWSPMKIQAQVTNTSTALVAACFPGSNKPFVSGLCFLAS